MQKEICRTIDTLHGMKEGTKKNIYILSVKFKESNHQMKKLVKIHRNLVQVGTTKDSYEKQRKKIL